MKKPRRLPDRGAGKPYGNLEEKVQERTRELTLLNRELRDEILARIKNEELLLGEKVYLEALEDNLYAGIVIVDRAGRHTHINNAFTAMTGYSKGDLYGKGMPYPYWAPQDRTAAAKRMRSILKGGEAPEDGFELRYISRDGRELNVAIYPFPLIVHDGLHGYILTVFNITARKRAESSLRESEESIRSLIESLPVGICIVQDGRAIFANTEMRRIFYPDHPGSEPDLTHWFKRVHPEDAAAIRELLREGPPEGGAPREREVRILPIRPKNSPVEMRWARGRAIRFHHLGKDAILLILIDITQAKEFERIFAVQEKLASLGQITAGIAHEIRNPLSGINLSVASFLETLDRLEAGMDPETHRSLQTAAERIKSLSKKIELIIQRVMGLAKPAPYPVRPVDMNLIAEESLRASSPLLRKGDVTVTRNLAADLPKCTADLHLMEQVLCNLISNAVRAMGSNHGPRLLEVRSSAKSGQVTVSISDSGPGIPKSIQSRIFEPFFTTHSEGHGIGLSISYRIVTEHGGTITVGKSRWGGAEFCITLPAADSSRSGPGEASP